MIFDEILDSIENEDIKEFAKKKCIPTVEDYFWVVPASSTRKYHPDYACTEGGLAKHTVALVRFLNHMFGVESITSQFTSRERDLLRVAGMMHDTRKSGTQKDYERSKWTRFDHPLQAAAVIRGLDGLPKEEIEMIAHMIESHMGQWCTDKRNPDVVLPKPTDKYQIILHVADYLASRKDIEVKFDGVEFPTKKEAPPNISTWVIPFGKKHKGETLKQVAENDPGYIEWAKDNITSEPMKTLLAQL